MSSTHYYHVCNRHKGRPVEIRTCHGRTYRGIIRHVDNHRVYIQPFDKPRGLGGFGFGFFGPAYRPYGPYRPYGYRRFRPGFGTGVALGAISTLVLLPFFF